jgi:hypothetical protein
MTMHWALTDTRNRRWNMSARHIVLNLTSWEQRKVSRSREEIVQLEGGVNWPTRIGDVKASARVQRNGPDTPGREPTWLQGEISWVTRF